MNGLNKRDAALKTTDALPNGAATAYSTPIDLSKGAFGDFVALVEFLLTCPALNVTQQPDAKTLTYAIETAIDLAFTSPIALYPGVVVQTGAGGVGCLAATFRFRAPATVSRYVRVKAVGSATGNSSTASMNLEVLS
ncbi:hypothetical protein BH11PLA2_BH11PLA2_34560 [soil metagenome]